jgi:glutathione synthase/RimK-type ligase-like ATP-grasp enzyme
MILIVTHKEDYTVDFVVEKLNKRKIAYRRLNCEDIDKSDYRFEFTPNVNYSLLGCSHFDSVWFRRTKVPDVSNELSVAEREFLSQEYYSLVQNILLTIDAKFLSHPTCVYAAENKMLQLSVAGSVGFNIPNTTVTNERPIIQKHFKKSNHGLAIKALSENKIIDGEKQKLIFTNKLSQQIVDNLDHYGLTPCIIQEYIEKQYELRVTVVGESVFAVRIMSQSQESTKVDWRRDSVSMTPYTLPKDITDKCLMLIRKLGLSFGAIDLIRDDMGQYYFLEINPNGQWAWIEAETGLAISDAIINFLS